VTDSFVKRRVEIAVKLAPRTGTNQPTTFVESGTDTVTLAGFRTSVKVQNSGSAAGSQASVSIWGMSPSLMNQLSTLGMVVSIIPRNTMTIAAGDEGGSMTTVFVGTIRDAYGDYAGAPQVPFRFECYSGAAEQVIPFPASSYDGTTDVATMLSAIARRIGWGFENNSVNVKLVSPYLSGSAMQQVETICDQARISYALLNNVLCIWPRNGERSNPGGIPLISKTTGMIGYPSFTQQGIMVRTLFNPSVTFGSLVKVQSDLFTTEALQRIRSDESVWKVTKLDHALDALVPKGEWGSTILAYNPRYQRPILSPTTGAR
jgi:hypothetical protein